MFRAGSQDYETLRAWIASGTPLGRKDAPHDCFTAEDALANAPRSANQLFIVPKVIE